MKILVIDDDLDLGELTERTLIKYNYQAKAFNDPQAAINHAHQNKPNLILMDINMPDISGPEIVKNLRNDSLFENIPIVFITGLITNNERSLQNEGLVIDGIKYPALSKPYKSEDLINMVKKYAR